MLHTTPLEKREEKTENTSVKWNIKSTQNPFLTNYIHSVIRGEGKITFNNVCKFELQNVLFEARLFLEK